MKIAIVGSGQLARMLALAGWPMGFQFSFLAQAKDGTSSVEGLGPVVVAENYPNTGELYQALGCPEVVTVVNENIDFELLHRLGQYCSVYPDPETVSITQHRHRQKMWLEQLGFPTAQFEFSSSRCELLDVVQALKLPVFIKACEPGKQGRQVLHVETTRQLAVLSEDFCFQPQLIEKAVTFRREISLIGVRARNGEIVLYPATENHHWQGTLLTSIAPAEGIPAQQLFTAKQLLCRIMENANHVGALTMECFVTDEGLLINQISPRVHDSGNWTLQGCATSQFENHLRAISGQHLGNSHTKGYTGMVNLLGIEANPKQLSRSNTQIHFYNRAPHYRRKTGHINVSCSRKDALRVQLSQMVTQLYHHPELAHEDRFPVAPLMPERQSA